MAQVALFFDTQIGGKHMGKKLREILGLLKTNGTSQVYLVALTLSTALTVYTAGLGAVYRSTGEVWLVTTIMVAIFAYIHTVLTLGEAKENEEQIEEEEVTVVVERSLVQKALSHIYSDTETKVQLMLVTLSWLVTLSLYSMGLGSYAIWGISFMATLIATTVLYIDIMLHVGEEQEQETVDAHTNKVEQNKLQDIIMSVVCTSLGVETVPYVCLDEKALDMGNGAYGKYIKENLLKIHRMSGSVGEYKVYKEIREVYMKAFNKVDKALKESEAQTGGVTENLRELTIGVFNSYLEEVNERIAELNREQKEVADKETKRVIYKKKWDAGYGEYVAGGAKETSPIEEYIRNIREGTNKQ